MIAIRLPSADDVAELVDALLAAADVCEHRAPDLAARRRALAEDIGDALDRLPQPTVTTEE